jgi:hypothetical protein
MEETALPPCFLKVLIVRILGMLDRYAHVAHAEIFFIIMQG